MTTTPASYLHDLHMREAYWFLGAYLRTGDVSWLSVAVAYERRAKLFAGYQG